MKNRHNLIAIPHIQTILMSLMCLGVLLLTPSPASAQDPKPSTITSKNTDGTTTTTEKYDWATKATTKDSAGKLIETVTTEPSDKFGKGGTKAKIEAQKNGNDVDTVVYKDKAGNVRRAEEIEFTKRGKEAFDANYDASGRITSFAFGRLNNITEEGKVEYDELGRPLTVLSKVSNGTQYRIGYKYDGPNDKTGTQTVERYDRYTKKWKAVGLLEILGYGLEHVLGNGNKLLAAIRKATERQMSIIGDISPINPPDMEAPKQKKDPGKIDPCLVGTWRSEPGGEGIYGSGGIVLTIKPDGMATFDYDGMKPWVAASTIKVTGKASGQLSFEGNKYLGLAGDFTSSVTETETRSDGTSRVSKTGGFFPSGAQVSEYTCTKDTLTLFANMKFKKVE